MCCFSSRSNRQQRAGTTYELMEILKHGLLQTEDPFVTILSSSFCLVYLVCCFESGAASVVAVL